MPMNRMPAHSHCDNCAVESNCQYDSNSQYDILTLWSLIHATVDFFLLELQQQFAGALLAACAPPKQTIDAKDVPVGSAVIVGNFIITQPTSGVYHAYSATCPHQGAKISQVNGDTVTCTNHNSVFSITDGAPVSGPSRAGLKEAKLKTDGNNKLTPEP